MFCKYALTWIRLHLTCTYHSLGLKWKASEQQREIWCTSLSKACVCPGSRTTLLNTEQRSRCTWEKSDSPKTHSAENQTQNPLTKSPEGKTRLWVSCWPWSWEQESVSHCLSSVRTQRTSLFFVRSRRYKEYLSPSPFPNFSCLQEPSFWHISLMSKEAAVHANAS